MGRPSANPTLKKHRELIRLLKRGATLHQAAHKLRKPYQNVRKLAWHLRKMGCINGYPNESCLHQSQRAARNVRSLLEQGWTERQIRSRFRISKAQLRERLQSEAGIRAELAAKDRAAFLARWRVS